MFICNLHCQLFYVFPVICYIKTRPDAKFSIVPEEGWFGQPKYSTRSKKHSTLCRFLPLYSSFFFVKPIRSLLIQRIRAGSSFRLLAITHFIVPRGRAPFGQHQEITTSGLVQHRKSTIHGLPVTLRMLRVKSDKSDWFWFQSIVFTKPFKNRMSLDQARGRDFLVLTKRSAASGDENAVSCPVTRQGRSAQPRQVFEDRIYLSPCHFRLPFRKYNIGPHKL